PCGGRARPAGAAPARSRHASPRPLYRRGVRRDVPGAARGRGRPRRPGQHCAHARRRAREPAMTAARDPIALELFKNTLVSIADEMALTIFRTAYSGVLKDAMDYSTAFCDGQGRVVAMGLTVPAPLGSFPEALAAVLARYGDRMGPGDIFCLNDPFEGGMHLPDIFVLKPIYHEGERVAFAATVCHHTDVGGRVA